MATHSIIKMITPDNGMQLIYCHYDGFADHHLPILNGHYNTIEKAQKLMDLGDLSILDVSPEQPEGVHCLAEFQPGYCLAYIRDDNRPVEENAAHKSTLKPDRATLPLSELCKGGGNQFAIDFREQNPVWRQYR